MGRQREEIQAGRGEELEKLASRIREFIAGARQPAAMEEGLALLPLEPGRMAVEVRGGRVQFEAWDERSNLHRRVTGIRQERAGELVLAVERFGGKQGRLLLVDLAGRRGWIAERRGRRSILRERFGRMLAREFPGVRVAELSSEPALEHSLSPTYPRALLKRGRQMWAALCAPRGAAGGALAAGLIWLEYLRRREREGCVGKLVLFVPWEESNDTLLRIPYLNAKVVEVEVYLYSEDGAAARRDPRDCGNIDTRLPVWQAPQAAIEPERGALLRELERDCEALVLPEGDGSFSVRVNGLEIARDAGEGMWVGLAGQRRLWRCPEEALAETARLVHAARRWDAEDRQHPLYRRNPEAWLESQIRRHMTALDANLMREPVYGQLPGVVRSERGILDLLAVNRSARLVVMEVKATADWQLPIQALDYWLRVKWHLERNEFPAKGYFPGVSLRREAPLVMLVAPALEFHPTTQTLIRYLAPEVEVCCVGVGLEWRRELKVMFRMEGGERGWGGSPAPWAG